MMVIIDVHYQDDKAHTVAAVVEDYSASLPLKVYSAIKNEIAPYESGQFYKRELPCVMDVLGKIQEPIDLIVLDGYVWLGENEEKGLGAYLYEKLDSQIPVIGVAKNSFRGSGFSHHLFRGDSQKPLYITSIGMSKEEASILIDKLEGEFRVPTLIKQIDTLSRKWEMGETVFEGEEVLPFL